MAMCEFCGVIGHDWRECIYFEDSVPWTEAAELFPAEVSDVVGNL